MKVGIIALKDRLGKVSLRTKEVTSKVTKKEDKEKINKVSIEDEILVSGPIILDEFFLKAIKSLSRKVLHGVPLISDR